jgi:putative transposase
MTIDRWTTSDKAVYNIGYHIIWCAKYRRKVLVNGIAMRLQALLAEKAAALEVQIATMEILPDRVYLFVTTPPTLSPHFIVQQFKGDTSRRLRDEFPALRSRLPTLWNRAYYCESYGQLTHAAVEQFLEAQRRL